MPITTCALIFVLVRFSYILSSDISRNPEPEVKCCRFSSQTRSLGKTHGREDKQERTRIQHGPPLFLPLGKKKLQKILTFAFEIPTAYFFAPVINCCAASAAAQHCILTTLLRCSLEARRVWPPPRRRAAPFVFAG